MTLTVVLEHVLRRGGQAAVDATLAAAGLAGREAEVRDERSWWSWTEKQALFAAAAEQLGDPLVTRHAAAATLECNVGPVLKVALSTLGSPQLVYANLPRANAKLSRDSRMHTSAVGEDFATIRFRHVVDVRPTVLDCEFNVGILSCVPRLFGLPAARVTHETCQCDGAPECVYEIRWEGRPPAARWARCTGAAGIATAACGVLAARQPAVAAGGALALGAGFAGALVSIVQTRRRVGALERELADRVRAAGDLRESLHVLASELDADRLLRLVEERVSHGIGCDAVAVLRRDGERLGVACARGLDETQLATVTAWAQVPRLAGAVAVRFDDLQTVAALAPLAHGELPLMSACAAQLVHHGRLLGLVVALARGPGCFLPHDVEWMEAYAEQAAIALANAELYAAQQEMARCDALTGLRNHREFHDAVSEELGRSRPLNADVSVALVDLDDFKAINDGSGHAAGDALLREVAAALSASCRAGDAVFRVGGDEFAVVMPATSAVEAAAAAARLVGRVADCDRRIGASVGVATWPYDGDTKERLLDVADARVYEAKGAGARGFARTE